MDLKDKIIRRYFQLLLVLVFLFLVAVIKILVLQSNKKKEILVKRAKPIVNEEIEPKRGDIYDAKGRILATSLPLYSIYFDPGVEALTDSIFYAKIDSLDLMLNQYFHNDPPVDYAGKFTKARKKGIRFVHVADRLDYYQLQDIKKFPIFRRGRYKGGLIYQVNYERIKPYGDLAYWVIGKNDIENPFGIEKKYNDVLGGKVGYGVYRKLPGGYKQLYVVNSEPEDGEPVYSTIDIDIQDVVHQALLRQLKETKAEFGVAILMDVKTGDVKAMVNLSRSGTNDTLYLVKKNNAVSYLYEPGSVMKLASMMALFEDNDRIKLTDSVNTGRGILRIGRDFTVRDYNADKGGFGWLTVQNVFEVSSNVGVAKLVMKQYRTKSEQSEFVERLKNMHLGKMLNIDLPGEVYRPLKEPETGKGNGKRNRWWTGSLAQMAIGYEMMLTPLQILTFYNAVANDGRMVKPRFVYKVVRDGKEQELPVEVISPSIAKKSTIKKAKAMMEGVVERGTAEKYVKSDIVKIAGKTGTAQIYNDSLKTYLPNENNVTFVGYFPADNPKYSMIVMLHKPQKHKGGGSGAGPVFKEVAEKLYESDYSMHSPKDYDVRYMPVKRGAPQVKNGYTADIVRVLKYLNVKYTFEGPKVKTWAKTYSTDSNVVIYHFAKPASKTIMPNYQKFSAKDVAFLLDGSYLNTHLIGRGSVVRQTIGPGSKFRKGDNVKIYLKQ